MVTLQNKSARDGRGRFVYLYFQCIEFDRAKWQISLKRFLSQFQIETAPPSHPHDDQRLLVLDQKSQGGKRTDRHQLVLRETFGHERQ